FPNFSPAATAPALATAVAGRFPRSLLHRLSVLSVAAAAVVIETDDGDGSVVSRRERRWFRFGGDEFGFAFHSSLYAVLFLPALFL
ncbi:hypothetical protein A2U01_0086208, partial [Trifolium medium]|nr:hypothetical protein [Trifolium medium]